MIDVEELSFEYPNLRALDQVGFHIPAGSITALVGPNGAGKTTLLRCLAALTRPYAGRVRIDGLDTQDDPRGVHRRVGYLSDFFGLYDQLSVRQSLLHMAAAHDQTGDLTGLARATAERLGLSRYFEVRAGELSRGLRQRLAIAQAIIHQPRVLLLDEPASGLDPEARFSLGELFLELRDAGMTLLVSSHILAELEQYASDILILRGGRILDHRTVHHADEQKRLFELQLVHEEKTLADILTDQREISDIQFDGTRAEFQFSGDAAAEHRLLKTLLEADMPICRFAPRKSSLQETYLEQMRGKQGEA